VPKGTTVTWAWTGRKPHNVVAKKGPDMFRSDPGALPGWKWSHKMTKRGTYKVVCEIHQFKMTLKVT
jgi:plastocyanin